MKKLLVSTAIVLIAASCMTIGVAGPAALSALGFGDKAAERRHDLLNPTFRITAKSADGISHNVAKGSGTVVHSGDDGVFILTNHHVIALAQKDRTPDAGPAEVTVEGWEFIPGREHALPVQVTARIASDDEADDLALLRVTDPDFRAETVAVAMPSADRLEMGDPVFAVGGGLGNRPFITEGLVSVVSISGMHAGVDGHTMISAPIISGNSGGGAYVLRSGRYEFFGVTDAIESTHDVIVPHMGLVIPMDTVRPFLLKAGVPEFTPPPKPHLFRNVVVAG